MAGGKDQAAAVTKLCGAARRVACPWCGARFLDLDADGATDLCRPVGDDCPGEQEPLCDLWAALAELRSRPGE